VIGRVQDLQSLTRTAALAYWQGQYVPALDTVGLSSYECQTLPNLKAY
jgi:hypothetical protein